MVPAAPEQQRGVKGGKRMNQVKLIRPGASQETGSGNI